MHEIVGRKALAILNALEKEEKMICKDCKYLGREFIHLKGHMGCDDWRECTYRLPYFATQQAVPVDFKHNCKVFLPLGGGEDDPRSI